MHTQMARMIDEMVLRPIMVLLYVLLQRTLYIKVAYDYLMLTFCIEMWTKKDTLPEPH